MPKQRKNPSESAGSAVPRVYLKGEIFKKEKKEKLLKNRAEMTMKEEMVREIILSDCLKGSACQSYYFVR